MQYQRGGGNAMGLGLLRSGNQSDLLRHRQSWRLECRPAARRQQVEHHASSPAIRKPARPSGLIRSLPHDYWDYDEIMENILIDMDWKGSMRKLLIHPGRTGFVFVLDRETGELLAAQKFMPSTNWAIRIRPEDRASAD